MKNPVLMIPEALKSLQALGAAAEATGVPGKTLWLVHLRASQINGCSVCVDMHRQPHFAKEHAETDVRLNAVAAWRDTPYFSDAERAALALAECATRLSDRDDPVPDAVWQEAARHYDERQLAGLVVQIATANAFNRINAATRQIAGAWK